jgi:hypothetical protein
MLKTAIGTAASYLCHAKVIIMSNGPLHCPHNMACQLVAADVIVSIVDA